MLRPLALVTGASAGIGVEFARALAERHYDLLLVARRADRLESLAAQLRSDHRDLACHVLPTDLREPEACEAIMRALAERGLAVDLLINNAGFGSHGSFVDQARQNALDMIAVNVSALVGLTSALVPGMVERGHGGVINVASTAAFQALPYMAVYGATKAFVVSFSEALHEEVAARGVRVVALCPGPTRTEFFEASGMTDGLLVRGPQRSAAQVITSALSALERNQAVVIDGLPNAVLAGVSRALPRRLVRKAVARALGPSGA